MYAVIAVILKRSFILLGAHIPMPECKLQGMLTDVQSYLCVTKILRKRNIIYCKYVQYYAVIIVILKRSFILWC